MIHKERLNQVLPWSCVEPGLLERDAVLECIAGFEALQVNSDGTIDRTRPHVLDEQRAEALATIRLLAGQLRMLRLDGRRMTIDTDIGIAKTTAGDMLYWLRHGIEVLEPAPHPAPQGGPQQWSRFAARTLFLELQDVGALDWRAVANRDQAKFISACMREIGQHLSLRAPDLTSEGWRKMRDSFVETAPNGLYMVKKNPA